MGKKKATKKDTKGRETQWEWEETPELIEALKKLHKTPGVIYPPQDQCYNNREEGINFSKITGSVVKRISQGSSKALFLVRVQADLL